MALWWLQPGWRDATCPRCGDNIYPAGDPDWGRCIRCFEEDLHWERMAERYYAEMEADYMRSLAAEEEP